VFLWQITMSPDRLCRKLSIPGQYNAWAQTLDAGTWLVVFQFLGRRKTRSAFRRSIAGTLPMKNTASHSSWPFDTIVYRTLEACGEK